MKNWNTAIALGALAVGAVVAAPAAQAQGTSFPDVPQNHWAYTSVQSLADKGLVKGYPNGQFLGNRALTRYEFATVVDRLLQTIADMKSGATPTNAVTQDDLNKIQVLVDSFKTELTAIQADVTKAQADIAELRGNVEDLRQDVLDTKDLANKAQDTANNSYGVGAKRKFQISGYIQARYFDATGSDNQDPKSVNHLTYPHGKVPGNSPYNGTYASGSNGASFIVRRSRLKFTGQLTQNTRYAIQLDASGFASPTSTPNSSNASSNAAVSVREGNATYAFGNGDPAKNLSITAGMFANPFGYILPLSSASTIQAERPLAFNEGGQGLFANQDYDRGVQVAGVAGPVKYTVALVNGTGLASNDTDRQVDQIYRLAYQTGDKKLGVGASFYNGHVADYSNTGAAYTSRKKQLTGADVQYNPTANIFLNGEYVEGKFEQRTAYAGLNQGALALATTYAPGNKIEGYYALGGYSFSPAGTHTLTLAASYDEFNRAKSGAGSNSSYTDKNFGYGALYNLDKSTRLRLWYTKPNKVAHAPGAVDPEKVGLFVSELQVKF
ncbi:porin [Capsulimonas corticalis]|uniref:porin n=1 Tax=Capsulimonas corticalis TaxID=2219043 RepID=UPI000FFA3691|nr:porin [Capsulimonas corticalis]